MCDYQRAHEISAIALRYFNASGADPEGELGELRDPETHLIPRAMMAIQGHIHDFAVFGTDYPTPDGTAIRDYVHVCDLADAHVAAVRRLLAGGEGGAFNLGTGRGYSVKQVLDAIAAETGESLPISTAPRRQAIRRCWSPMPRSATGNSVLPRDCLILRPSCEPLGLGIAGPIQGWPIAERRASPS